MLQHIIENQLSQESVTLSKLAYSIEEISEQTSLSKAFLRLEIKRKKLKIRRFGRRILVRNEDLLEYLAAGSDGAQTEIAQ